MMQLLCILVLTGKHKSFLCVCLTAKALRHRSAAKRERHRDENVRKRKLLNNILPEVSKKGKEDQILETHIYDSNVIVCDWGAA